MLLLINANLHNGLFLVHAVIISCAKKCLGALSTPHAPRVLHDFQDVLQLSRSSGSLFLRVFRFGLMGNTWSGSNSEPHLQANKLRMELNSKTIGSWAALVAAQKAERRARIGHALMFVWLTLVVSAIPFVFGFWVGGNVADGANAWADSVIAK